MKRKLIILFLLLTSELFTFAQQSRTLFFMHELAQSNYVNPAIQPRCKVFLGVPLLSSTYINASSTGFSYHKLSPGSRNFDASKLVQGLQGISYLTGEAHLNILAIGIKHNDFYFSFNIAEKVNATAYYPKSIAEVATKGNDHLVGKTLTTTGLGVSAFHLREYSLGVAQEVDWNYKWGIRGKLLFGKSNIASKKSGISLTTEQESYDLLASWEYQISTSLPLSIPSIEPFDILSLRLENINPLNYLFNSRNVGLAFDMGIVYLSDHLTWSGSIIDAGAILWRSEVNNFVSNGNFAFEGISINDNIAPDEFIEMITDSISNQMRVVNINGSYFTFLPTKLNLGATYELHPKLNAGLLFRTEFYPRRPVPSLTISLNTAQLKNTVASLSYSIMNGSFNNLGLGIGFGKNNFSLHFISDNILAYIHPIKAHTANLRFGLSMQFGCNEKKKSFKYSGPGCYWEL